LSQGFAMGVNDQPFSRESQSNRSDSSEWKVGQDRSRPHRPAAAGTHLKGRPCHPISSATGFVPDFPNAHAPQPRCTSTVSRLRILPGFHPLVDPATHFREFSSLIAPIDSTPFPLPLPR
jgi:hypothetical protein